jgi:hypothetical protein
MPRICSICKFTRDCEFETFNVNGIHNHYCVDHIDNRPGNGIHIPCSLDLQPSDSGDIRDYSGRCKVCVKIGHEYCLGCFYVRKQEIDKIYTDK